MARFGKDLLGEDGFPMVSLDSGSKSADMSRAVRHRVVRAYRRRGWGGIVPFVYMSWD